MPANRYMLTFFVASLLLLPTISSAHLSTELLYCPVLAQVGPTHIPKFREWKPLTNGLISELYDVTGDGIPDIAAYSALADGDTSGDDAPYHKDVPIFYEIDIDGDRKPDELYIDPKGFGKCEDLVIYSDEEDGGLVSWKPDK